MPGINITVKNKIARADGAHYVCGNSDYVANFKFDSEWDEYETKTARFSYNGSYVDVVFEGEQCPIPIISNTYFFLVGVYAGNLHTTTPARVPCKKSILCGGGSPADPTPDVYAQLMERMSQLENADWSQNDETAKNYVKNRTHYVEKGAVVQFVAETSITAESWEEDGRIITYADFEIEPVNALPYSPGEATIVFDGKSYLCEMVEHYEPMGGTSIAVGNLNLSDPTAPKTGEPFAITINFGALSDELPYVGVWTTVAGEHTVSFEAPSAIYHKLCSSRYLDSTALRGIYSYGSDEEEILFPAISVYSENCAYVNDGDVVLSAYGQGLKVKGGLFPFAGSIKLGYNPSSEMLPTDIGGQKSYSLTRDADYLKKLKNAAEGSGALYLSLNYYNNDIGKSCHITAVLTASTKDTLTGIYYDAYYLGLYAIRVILANDAATLLIKRLM